MAQGYIVQGSPSNNQLDVHSVAAVKARVYSKLNGTTQILVDADGRLLVSARSYGLKNGGAYGLRTPTIAVETGDGTTSFLPQNAIFMGMYNGGGVAIILRWIRMTAVDVVAIAQWLEMALFRISDITAIDSGGTTIDGPSRARNKSTMQESGCLVKVASANAAANYGLTAGVYEKDANQFGGTTFPLNATAGNSIIAGGVQINYNQDLYRWMSDPTGNIGRGGGGGYAMILMPGDGFILQHIGPASPVTAGNPAFRWSVSMAWLEVDPNLIKV